MISSSPESKLITYVSKSLVHSESNLPPPSQSKLSIPTPILPTPPHIHTPVGLNIFCSAAVVCGGTSSLGIQNFIRPTEVPAHYTSNRLEGKRPTSRQSLSNTSASTRGGLKPTKGDEILSYDLRLPARRRVRRTYSCLHRPSGR